ncbi:MAG: hypothetical protein LBT46_06485 [Planctomycetaceae bacterium]|jgi:nitrogenase molybdenum-iron protein NifN|nr:hypothetical protein [Planctomycetaceae bacterium]
MPIAPIENFVSTRNACKLCAPLGACLAMRGIEGCIPLIHGSQGCSTYIRRYGISHFREPIDIASSNFTESSAIFGGRDNLFQALDNITRQYQPAAIGVASTCLSETIGEDIRMYLYEYESKRHSKRPVIFHASTPSYRGTHIDGFHEAIRSVVCSVTKMETAPQKTGGVNIISGFVSAEDMREIHSILQSYAVPYTLLPDYSESLDGGAWDEYRKIAEGGTTLDRIKAMPFADGTLYLGQGVEPDADAGIYLQQHFNVPSRCVELPIGIENTDVFFNALEELTGKSMPEVQRKNRLRLIDAYFDGHKYCSGKRAVVYGEEDFVTGLASFLDEIGVETVLAATGAPGRNFETRITSVLRNSRLKPQITADTDFVTMLEVCKEMNADFILGNSKGLYLARELNVPLVRCGFPIHDRIGGHRILHLGYRGALNLFERICNTLIEAKQSREKTGWLYV